MCQTMENFPQRLQETGGATSTQKAGFRLILLCFEVILKVGFISGRLEASGASMIFSKEGDKKKISISVSMHFFMG